MTLTENPGTRPSKLALGRLATGELEPHEADAVRASVGDAEQAWLDGIQDARDELPAFDASALRARAASAEPADTAPSVPSPANDTRGFRALVPLLLMAALALVVAWPAIDPRPTGVDPDYVGVRSGSGLEAYHLEGGSLVRYDDRALGEGDVVGFKVSPGRHQGVVVLSVDGTGHVSVYWPASGEAPEPVRGDGPVALPGSVTLDGAPGPEVFVAVFDRPVSAARAEVQRTWQAGGRAGLIDWARSSGEADVAVVNRR